MVMTLYYISLYNIVTFSSRITAANKIYVQKEEISKMGQTFANSFPSTILFAYPQNIGICFQPTKMTLDGVIHLYK